MFDDVAERVERLRLCAAMGEGDLSKQLQKRAFFVGNFSAGQSLRQKRKVRREASLSHDRKRAHSPVRRCALFLTVCELFCFASERLSIKNVFSQLLDTKAERNT